MVETITYGQFIQLKDETDLNGNTVKVKAIFFQPAPEATESFGMCERITYNNQGKQIRWEFPPFRNKQLVSEMIGGNKVYFLQDQPL